MLLTLKLFGREFTVGAQSPAETTPAHDAKAVSPEMSNWLRLDDMEAGGEGAKLGSPYVQSSWVYIAISRLAEKVSSIPFRISRMDGGQARRVKALRGSSDPTHRSYIRRILGETIVESGDALDLFNRPHPTMNRQLFWEMVVTWKCLRGEFFVLPLDASDQPVDLSLSSARVARMITLPTDMFWHVVTGYELSGWRYTGSPLVSPLPSEMLLPNEVIHSRTPNPFLYWRGLSPLLLALGPAAADFAASQYNKGYWLNNADTGVIVTTDQQATTEQRDAILAALRERKRKAGTADRPLFLWGGAKVEKPTLSGMESQMIENRKMNRQEILAIYKMTDSVIGLTDSKSSALNGGGNAINQEEVKFIESTMAPLCQHLEAAVEPIVKSFGPGFVGWFDIDGLPVMQEARRVRLDAGVKAFGIGASFNDINRVYDLGFPEYAGWGDRNFLPLNLQQADRVSAKEESRSVNSESVGQSEALATHSGPLTHLPTDSRTTNKDESHESASKSRRDELHESPSVSARNAQSLQGITPQTYARNDVETYGDSQSSSLQSVPRVAVSATNNIAVRKDKVSKVLNEFRGIALAGLASCDLSQDFSERPLAERIFDSKQFGDRLFAELRQSIMAALKTAGEDMRKELGLNASGAMSPRQIVEFLGQRAQAMQDFGTTVRTKLDAALQAGVTAGETSEQLAARVKEIFNHLGYHEARRIAVLETNTACQCARQCAMAPAKEGK
jgi:HK97 family phage portal protein